jgi:SAM-dependent methyltransferase
MTGLSHRLVEPELLDALPPDDPQAVGSRRDLAVVNALMLQPRIMAGLLARHAERPPRRILEIGSGDGTPALKLAKRMHRRWPGVEIVLLDRLPALPPGLERAFAALGWKATAVTADAFAWLDACRETFDAALANLVLHHFTDAELAALFRALRPRARLFAATETRRDRFSLLASSLLLAIGANPVTRHDAPASVRAGFSGSELGSLWEAAGGRALEERRAFPFTHAFAGSGG